MHLCICMYEWPLNHAGIKLNSYCRTPWGDLIPWLLMSPMFAWLLQAYSQRKTQEILVNGISFKLVKFFGTMFVLRALDEVSDILTAMEYLK